MNDGNHLKSLINTQLNIFLCHASEDKEKVRALYKKLNNGVFRPWFDEIDILPGQDWDLEINKAVHNSHIVIVCLSKTSVSKTGYLQKEIHYVIDRALL